MAVTVTKIYYPAIFNVGSQVGFDLSDGSHYAGIITQLGSYYISVKPSNSVIFNKLNIEEPLSYVKNIVGYTVYGAWPEVKSLEDLKKVLRALERYPEYPNRIPEDRKPIISDDKDTKPFILKIKSKRNPSLNYKL